MTKDEALGKLKTELMGEVAFRLTKQYEIDQDVRENCEDRIAVLDEFIKFIERIEVDTRVKIQRIDENLVPRSFRPDDLSIVGPVPRIAVEIETKEKIITGDLTNMVMALKP